MSHPIPLLIADNIFEKKVSLIVFDIIFTKKFGWDTHFQFYNHESFEIIIRINSLIENSVQQDYLL